MNNFLKNTENMNAPTFANYARTGVYRNIYGRYAHHDQKPIKGILIDKNIPTKEMLLLMNLTPIEMRSSCEGSDMYGPFFIFRLPGKDDYYINKLCEFMNYSDKKIVCKFGVGANEEYRIIVTSSFLKDEVKKNEYDEWWKNSVKKLIFFFKRFPD
jgi:hypothetical protein